jgi:hypothetical protein
MFTGNCVRGGKDLPTKKRNTTTATAEEKRTIIKFSSSKVHGREETDSIN